VRELGKEPGVTVTGTVEDVRPYYCSALAAVVPLRIGGGTRLKILEAMAAGIPVISTRIGAEGLAVTSGANAMVADRPEDMARAVWDIYSSETRWRQLSQAGRELVLSRYDWSALGTALYELHTNAVGCRVHA